MATPEALSNRSTGYRVKHAREAYDMRQEQLAEGMGFKDRQTISDIENGKRSLKADELVSLAEYLGRDVDFFLDPFVVAGEAKFSWRVAPELPDETLDDFEARAGRLIGLLRWLREHQVGPASSLKASLRLSSKATCEEAQDRAESLVKQFGLGPVPADHLAQFMEEDLSLQVLYLDIPEGTPISGAFCHLNDLGVILINRNAPEGRRNDDLAHELFHALTWDHMEPDHRETKSQEDRSKGKRIEQLAANFTSALLMPMECLATLIDPNRREDAAHIAEVAARLRVTTQALGWRLFNLKWISDSTRAALPYERPSRPPSTHPNRYSLAFAVMLHKAIDGGRLSARKAAKALGMNLAQLGALFPEHDLAAPFDF
jgi:Zn-dependent peptidase ImmA (M78 family)/transcriptional regulator with XRE-family HTH domain